MILVYYSRVVTINTKGKTNKDVLMDMGSHIINMAKPPVSVVVTEGPIYSEIRQDFSNDAALLIRVFKTANPLLRTCLQQIVLLDKIETPQEFLLHVTTEFSNSDFWIDEGGIGSYNVTLHSIGSISKLA